MGTKGYVSKADKIPMRFQVKRPAYWRKTDSVLRAATFTAGVHEPGWNGRCSHLPVFADLAEKCEPAQSPVRLLSLMLRYASAGHYEWCAFDCEIRAGLPAAAWVCGNVWGIPWPPSYGFPQRRSTLILAEEFSPDCPPASGFRVVWAIVFSARLKCILGVSTK